MLNRRMVIGALTTAIMMLSVAGSRTTAAGQYHPHPPPLHVPLHTSSEIHGSTFHGEPHPTSIYHAPEVRPLPPHQVVHEHVAPSSVHPAPISHGAIAHESSGIAAHGATAPREGGVGVGSLTPHKVGVVAKGDHGVGMSPKPGERGGPGAGKRFDNATKAEALRENVAANSGRPKCVFCGESVGPGTRNKINIDHAEPRAKGGNNRIDNANVTCAYCNKSKGTGSTPRNPKLLAKK